MATATVPEPGRVLVSAVAEPREPWQTEICRLFETLRQLGGAVSAARATALFTGQPDAHTVATLEALQVDVRLITAVDPQCPHANKIRMLEQDDDVDWILALDTDMLITGDLSEQLRHPAVMLRVVDADPLSHAQWRRLFDYFGVELPADRLRTTCTGKKTPAYFNSGAVFVPRTYAAPLAAAWRDYVQRLLSAYNSLGDVAHHAFYTDQIALSLALASSEVPVQPLPVEVNTPSHSPIHRRWRPGSITPRLVHYHHQVDAAGRVSPSGYVGVDSQIDRANAVWLAVKGGVTP